MEKEGMPSYTISTFRTLFDSMASKVNETNATEGDIIPVTDLFGMDQITDQIESEPCLLSKTVVLKMNLNDAKHNKNVVNFLFFKVKEDVTVLDLIIKQIRIMNENYKSNVK